MVATQAPVVLGVYPDREHAQQLVALLREHGIPVAVVPSDQYVGEWDVLVPARAASCATKKVSDLLDVDLPRSLRHHQCPGRPAGTLRRSLLNQISAPEQYTAAVAAQEAGCAR
jgi:hypothetical protein